MGPRWEGACLFVLSLKHCELSLWTRKSRARMGSSTRIKTCRRVRVLFKCKYGWFASILLRKVSVLVDLVLFSKYLLVYLVPCPVEKGMKCGIPMYFISMVLAVFVCAAVILPHTTHREENLDEGCGQVRMREKCIWEMKEEKRRKKKKIMKEKL